MQDARNLVLGSCERQQIALVSGDDEIGAGFLQGALRAGAGGGSETATPTAGCGEMFLLANA